jgi:formate dehydrogenase major subunit
MGGMLYTEFLHIVFKRYFEEEIKTIRSLGSRSKQTLPSVPALPLMTSSGKIIEPFSCGGGSPGPSSEFQGRESPCRSRRVFLRKVNLGEKVEVGERVGVIGGGNVAIDAARAALRLGAKEVTILYRRSRNEMPAYEEDIEEAEEEGIKFQFLSAPTEVVSKDGKGISLRCIRMELAEPDASGRRRPIPIEGSDFLLELDTVIPAIGQAPDLSFLTGMEIETSPQGTIKVDPVTLQTSRQGIFAGGDAVSGPWIAIEAVAAGKEAAVSIDRYLRKNFGGERNPSRKARMRIMPDNPGLRERMERLPLRRGENRR